VDKNRRGFCKAVGVEFGLYAGRKLSLADARETVKTLQTH
jgi:hypothetical protein